MDTKLTVVASSDLIKLPVQSSNTSTCSMKQPVPLSCDEPSAIPPFVDCHSLKENMLKLFAEADLDNNELINFEDFSSVIAKLMPEQSIAETHKLFNALDSNKRGYISLTELEDDSNIFFSKLGFVCTENDSVPVLRSISSPSIDSTVSVKLNLMCGSYSEPIEFLSSSDLTNEMVKYNDSFVYTTNQTVSNSPSTRHSSIALTELYAEQSFLGKIFIADEKGKIIIEQEVNYIIT